MKNEILKQIIYQIEKYELDNSFSYVEEFKEWVSKLNSIQINNFLSLDINLDKVKNIKSLLINQNLLDCDDYKQKIDAMSKLKNLDGCSHLCMDLCNPNFLKSKKFYNDIEILSKMDTARYGLLILGKDVFINSPYHDEDLRLIVTSDSSKRSDALATVASDINFIKSPYHQMDMNLIATSKVECLQFSHSYPQNGLNNLAINKVSLQDKYHLENMQILATNPLASKCLYIIMTDPSFVNAKNYRKVIEALVNSKSETTVKALLKYMSNLNRCGHTSNDICLENEDDYLKNLIRINKMDDEFVHEFVYLLLRKVFINSPYKEFDLELLSNVTDATVFTNLCYLMENKDSINSSHHKKDVAIISQTTDEALLELLMKKATDSISLNSYNHDYDMEYISKLNLDSIDQKIYDKINYYLFSREGIQNQQHRPNLEKLSKGILVDGNSILTYLNTLKKQIDDNKDNDYQIIQSVPVEESHHKSKVLNLFKKSKKQR